MGRRMQGGIKNDSFLPLHFISEMMQDRAVVMEGE